MKRPAVFVVVLSLMSVAQSASESAWPFLFDVGALNASIVAGLSNASGRVQFGAIFECPHPCGLIPSIAHLPNGSVRIVNGGVPSSPSFNLSEHLGILDATFAKFVPVNDDRWIDVDYESWDPIWSRNVNSTKDYAVSLARAEHPSWNPSQLEKFAAAQFEKAALDLLVATVEHIHSIRPKLKVGLYGLPDRLYYNGYNSTAGPQLRTDNDRLYPLWCVLDGLFPSVYQFYNSCETPAQRPGNVQYVSSVVAEAVRIAKGVPSKCTAAATVLPGGVSAVGSGRPRPMPPVLAYTWHRYHSSPSVGFVCDGDEAMYWQQAHAVGADGIVLWGNEPTAATSRAFSTWWEMRFVPLAEAWPGVRPRRASWPKS